MREGDWKLVREKGGTSPANALFLANLADDVGEQINQAPSHPEIVARLQKLHDEWFDRANLRRAEPNR